MNIVLVTADELDTDACVPLAGRRLAHVRDVLKKGPGDTVRVGQRGGELGSATIEAGNAGWRLRCVFDAPPPPKAPITVVLALPRPPVLRRVVQHLTALGVARIVLVHTQRVEKSYWSSPAVAPEALAEQIDLGLEQAVDTIPPRLEEARRFRPFVEDRLAALAEGGALLVADPRADEPCPCDVPGPVTLVVGPEGGFVPFELALLTSVGARGVALGPRVLRVETAVIALVARLGLQDHWGVCHSASAWSGE